MSAITTDLQEQLYIGSPTPLPERILLKAGELTCLYERGWLRYITYGPEELIRKVYSTVRDERWLTAPFLIYDENIQQESDSFIITYGCEYRLNNILYHSRVSIRGTAGNEIVYSFDGMALCTFLRNRIGICLHLPIDTCHGRVALVGHTSGKSEPMVFPEPVSPGQPFSDMRSIAWTTPQHTGVAILLEGDVFEAEDQRNWTDASYKIYSTPLSKPFPVEVAAGDKVRQSVVIKVSPAVTDPLVPTHASTTRSVNLFTGDTCWPFPCLGYSKGLATGVLTDEEIRLLQQVPFDHYRADLRLYTDWQPYWQAALQESQRLQVRLELAVFFSDNYMEEGTALIRALGNSRQSIRSILLLHEGYDFTPLFLQDEMLPLLRSHLPDIEYGVGTDAFFAEWNRNFTKNEGAGFTAYSINPQVHADDYLSFVENLAAQADTVRTAKEAAQNRPLHISPLTLKMRYDPGAIVTSPTGAIPLSWNTDPRQSSLFMAAWTCLAIKYSGQAQKITLFEAAGPGGILTREEQGYKVYPVYLLLQELYAFKPVRILTTRSDRPLIADAIVLANQEGGQLYILCNFTGADQPIRWSFPEKSGSRWAIKELTMGNYRPLLSSPSSFLSMNYRPLATVPGKGWQLPAFSIIFMKQL